MSPIEPPPLTVAVGVYAAALDIALTTDDEYERRGALWLMHEMGEEMFGPLRERRVHRGHQRPGSGSPRPDEDRTLARLIREVLQERLSLPEDEAEAA